MTQAIELKVVGRDSTICSLPATDIKKIGGHMANLRFPNINSTILSARLTKDVELKYLPNGTPLAKLSLAFNRNYQKNGEWKQETGYINATVWNKKGEACAEYLSKGSPVLVEGYLRTNSFTDKNKNPRQIMELVATKISFLEKKEENDNVESEHNNEKQAPVAEISDTDVPF